MKIFRLVFVLASLSVVAAGCAFRLAPPVVSENIAVVALVNTARADAEARSFSNAAASIERALRIEPKNPRLWLELARVRLKEGDYAQAESLAARANSWVGGDNELRAENWRLIGEARAARGDAAGAKAALERAQQAER